MQPCSKCSVLLLVLVSWISGTASNTFCLVPLNARPTYRIRYTIRYTLQHDVKHLHWTAVRRLFASACDGSLSCLSSKSGHYHGVGCLAEFCNSLKALASATKSFKKLQCSINVLHCYTCAALLAHPPIDALLHPRAASSLALWHLSYPAVL